MLAGIREILIISTKEDLPRFRKMLGNSGEFGISLSYLIQHNPGGLAQALIIGEKFIGNDSVALILGDNIFFGQGFTEVIREAVHNQRGATIFGYRVKDAKRFGVVEFDSNRNVLSIEEKPSQPKSDYVITGLYFYDNNAIDYAKRLKPSDRGELEITDLNNIYLTEGNLNVEILGRGFAWLDTGTHESLLEASQFIQTIENRQGFKVACLEEIAFNMGYINLEKL